MQGRNKFLKEISSNIISSLYVLCTYDPAGRLRYNLVSLYLKKHKKQQQKTTHIFKLDWVEKLRARFCETAFDSYYSWSLCQM